MESEPGVWHRVKIRAVWGRDFVGRPILSGWVVSLLPHGPDRPTEPGSPAPQRSEDSAGGDAVAVRQPLPPLLSGDRLAPLRGENMIVCVAVVGHQVRNPRHAHSPASDRADLIRCNLSADAAGTE